MAVPNESTADRWEDIKPTFLRLYQDENKPLEEVRRELEENYHFKARSAFTRHIEMWNAFKNYKALEKQLLASQRIDGQRPKVDLRGRPIKWDRVYRATRGQGIPKLRQGSRLNATSLAEGARLRACAAQPLSQPMDNDSRVLSCVVDIWRCSTVQFGSRDPLAASYRIDYSLYHRLIQSMAVITLCSKLEWPKSEIDFVCNAMPELVEKYPSTVCDLLNFLTTRQPSETFPGFHILRNQLFHYIRGMSRQVLPEGNPLRRFTSQLDDREAFTRLAAAMVKAKVDTMWNTFVFQAGHTQHDRPFFRQVIVNAILVVMDYDELEFAATFLKKLSVYGPKDPFYLAACERLRKQQGKREEAVGNRDEAPTLADTLDTSNSGEIVSA